MLARKGNRKYVVKEKMTLCIEVVNVCIYGNKTIITGREKKKKKHLLFVSSLRHIMERKDGKKNKGKEHAE